MALAAGVFIVASDVRMSILAMGSPMRPYTLTQTDQNTLKSCLQTGRAIRFFANIRVVSDSEHCLVNVRHDIIM